MADKIKFKKPVDFNGQTVENLNIPAEALAGKQDKLIAGNNITINGNVISASGGGGGSYNYINETDEKLTLGARNFEVDGEGEPKYLQCALLNAAKNVEFTVTPYSEDEEYEPITDNFIIYSSVDNEADKFIDVGEDYDNSSI